MVGKKVRGRKRWRMGSVNDWLDPQPNRVSLGQRARATTLGKMTAARQNNYLQYLPTLYSSPSSKTRQTEEGAPIEMTRIYIITWELLGWWAAISAVQLSNSCIFLFPGSGETVSDNLQLLSHSAGQVVPSPTDASLRLSLHVKPSSAC